MLKVRQLQAYIDSLPVNHYLQLQIVEVDEGRCLIKMPYSPELVDSWSGEHDGDTMILADLTGWLALATLYGIDKVNDLNTLELNTRFFELKKHQDLYVDACVIEDSREKIVVDIVISNLAGKVVSRSTVTYTNIELN